MSLLEALASVLKEKEWKGLVGLKKMIIYVTLLAPFVLAVQDYFFMAEVTGKIPLPEEMIKSYGHFEVQSRLQHGKYSGVSIFHAENGKSYILEKQFEFNDLENWVKKNPGERVYVKGFFLKNGRGAFYVAYIGPDSGEPLLLEKECNGRLPPKLT